MTEKTIVVNLAGIETAFRLHFGGTEMLFRLYEKQTQIQECLMEFSVPKEKTEEYAAEYGCSLEFAEFCCLRRAAGAGLTKYNRAVFHGVAFIYGGGAYILTAPSGTGKSTQLSNLRRLYGSRYRVICGDKPILRLEKDKSITVFPSPWNGKESWGGKEEAKLKGLVVLEQGKDNRFRRLNINQALIPVMQQFLYMTSDEAGIHVMCRIADTMLRCIPIYSYQNRGDDESSIMLNALLQSLEAEAE